VSEKSGAPDSGNLATSESHDPSIHRHSLSLLERMGGWIGGQAEYVMVPYADFNLLKFPDKAQAMEKIRD
jgi:threonine dehydrogenase-like Zn-dependent dehydrogenase